MGSLANFLHLGFTPPPPPLSLQRLHHATVVFGVLALLRASSYVSPCCWQPPPPGRGPQQQVPSPRSGACAAWGAGCPVQVWGAEAAAAAAWACCSCGRCEVPKKGEGLAHTLWWLCTARGTSACGLASQLLATPCIVEVQDVF
jgi:hypothetical protein